MMCANGTSNKMKTTTGNIVVAFRRESNPVPPHHRRSRDAGKNSQIIGAFTWPVASCGEEGSDIFHNSLGWQLL